MSDLSVERLHELFELHEGGRIVRKTKTCRRNKVGDIAGCKNTQGYLVVRVNGKTYYAHRIVIAMLAGAWPQGQIDHINGDRSDNTPSNLRVASNGQNQHNAKLRADNSSGVKGVYWNAANRNWVAQIWVDGKAISLGSHEDIELAELVVSEARIKYHGEFSRAA